MVLFRSCACGGGPLRLRCGMSARVRVTGPEAIRLARVMSDAAVNRGSSLLSRVWHRIFGRRLIARGCKPSRQIYRCGVWRTSALCNVVRPIRQTTALRTQMSEEEWATADVR